MAAYITIPSCDVCECRGCGQPITFATNRHGRRFPVDAVRTPDDRQWAWRRLGNLIPHHKCEPLEARPLASDRQREYERRCAELATHLPSTPGAIATWTEEYAALAREFPDITGID